jgi:putative nucleotidyltransferase with HDIG domain
MLERELKLIENKDIREGTKAILEKYKDWIQSFPPSPSGKHHLHEVTMEDHLIDTVACAEEIAREFKIKGEQLDILIAACLLHDIGRTKTTFLGQKEEGNWKYYPHCGWSQYDYGKKHPYDGAEVIKLANEELKLEMPKIEEICDLVKCHMSHWYAYCPQPTKLLDYAICMADYMATIVPKLDKEMEARRLKKC